MKRYRVIWFDDKYKELEVRVKERAHLNDIELVGFTNAADGILELKRCIKDYDAAIIDGLFFSTSSQSVDPTSDDPLNDVLHTLKELEPVKILPSFVLSGQPTFTSAVNPVAYTWKRVVYDKNSDADIDKLWEDIREASVKQEETQLRHDYQDAFSVCTERHLGEDSAKSVLLLLETLKTATKTYDTEEKLNAIRKIVEKVFACFNRIKVLPDEVWKGSGSINNSSKFLAGKHPNYIFHKEIFPPCISEIVRNLLAVTQDGSHAEGDLKLRIDSFIKCQPTGYLFAAVVYQLLELLVWSKSFFEENQDEEKNKSFASLKPSAVLLEEGVIGQDGSNNYFCGDLLIPYSHMTGKKYKVGDRIRILKIAENTNVRTSHLYSKIVVDSLNF